jgi:hypothetical protein
MVTVAEAVKQKKIKLLLIVPDKVISDCNQ